MYFYSIPAVYQILIFQVHCFALFSLFLYALNFFVLIFSFSFFYFAYLPHATENMCSNILNLHLFAYSHDVACQSKRIFKTNPKIHKKIELK